MVTTYTGERFVPLPPPRRAPVYALWGLCAGIRSGCQRLAEAVFIGSPRKLGEVHDLLAIEDDSEDVVSVIRALRTGDRPGGADLSSSYLDTKDAFSVLNDKVATAGRAECPERLEAHFHEINRDNQFRHRTYRSSREIEALIDGSEIDKRVLVAASASAETLCATGLYKGGAAVFTNAVDGDRLTWHRSCSFGVVPRAVSAVPRLLKSHSNYTSSRPTEQGKKAYGWA